MNIGVKKGSAIENDGFDWSDFSVGIKIFSDNIFIYLKYPEPENYRIYITWFLKLVAAYQYTAIAKYKLLVRGAVGIGDFYSDNMFVIGPSLVETYEAEKDYAFYPRILICKSLRADFRKQENDEAIPLTRRDFDNNLFVDYLIYTNQRNKIAKELLQKHHYILIESFKKAKEYEHKLKILMAIMYHNRYCINTNEYEIIHRIGERVARMHGTTECTIDITEFLMKNSFK